MPFSFRGAQASRVGTTIVTDRDGVSLYEDRAGKVHLDVIDDGRLADRLECAWREKAPRKLARELEAKR